jgi:hypothetical protein
LGRLLAAAAILVALSLLGIALLAAGGFRLGPAPLGLDTRDWQGFEAPGQLYTIRLPPTWTMTSGVAGQPDEYAGPEGTIRIGHEAIPAGLGQDAWFDARYALIESQQAAGCRLPPKGEFQVVEVGSDNDRLYDIGCVPTTNGLATATRDGAGPWLVLAAVGDRGFDLRVSLSVPATMPTRSKAFILAVLRSFALWDGALPSPGPIELVEFTASPYGYSIGYPKGWQADPATALLVGSETPWAYLPIVDKLGSVPGPKPAIAPVGSVIAASAEVPPGTTLATWTAGTALTACGTPSRQEAIELDGATATISIFAACNGEYHLWVTALRGTTAWHVIWLNRPGSEAADRAIFDQMLATFVFPPV